jgi:hypothetical protein
MIKQEGSNLYRRIKILMRIFLRGSFEFFESTREVIVAVCYNSLRSCSFYIPWGNNVGLGVEPGDLRVPGACWAGLPWADRGAEEADCLMIVKID